MSEADAFVSVRTCSCGRGAATALECVYVVAAEVVVAVDGPEMDGARRLSERRRGPSGGCEVRGTCELFAVGAL